MITKEDLFKHHKKLKKEILSPEVRKGYVRQLFGERGEPFLFKLLVEDAIKVGEEDGIRKARCVLPQDRGIK